MSQTALVVGLTVSTLFIGEFKKAVSTIGNGFSSVSTCAIIFGNNDCPNIVHAIKQEIGAIFTSCRKLTAQGNNHIIFEPALKNYHLSFQNRPLNIKIEDSKVTISSNCMSTDKIKDFVTALHNKYRQDDVRAMTYALNKGDTWEFIMRRDRPNIRATTDMQSMLDDVEDFMLNREDEYRRDGRPYRRAYLVTGEPGTGKSTMAEKIAQTYGMGIYTVNLGSHKLTNDCFSLMIARVPPHNIILFDEFDKQYQEIHERESKIKITDSAILSVLDGVPRLNHGIIVIMTANSTTPFQGIADALMRPGRIDMHFDFNEKICDLPALPPPSQAGALVIRSQNTQLVPAAPLGRPIQNKACYVYQTIKHKVVNHPIVNQVVNVAKVTRDFFNPMRLLCRVIRMFFRPSKPRVRMITYG